MKHKYLYSLFFCLLLSLAVSAVYAQNMQYTGGSSVYISLSDGQKSYEFTTPQIKGRYNNRLKRFEFILSVQNVAPRQIGAFLISLFNSIFHPDQSQEVQLYVYLPTETRNFENFINPQTLLLNGQVNIAGKLYAVPITMNVKYTSKTLYYGLQGNISSDFGAITAAADEKPIHLREIQFVVPESPMGVYFED